jgi:hypothetical protein
MSYDACVPLDEMAESSFDPELELAVILDTDDPVAIALAKGSLEEAGIPFVVLDQISTLIESVDPFLHKRAQIQVGSDREAEAREALAPLLEPETSGDTPDAA